MGSKHEAITEELIREMDAGVIRPGHRLPSVREVAVRFGCSTNTAVRAFQTLERRNLVYAVAKSGYYMVELDRERRGPSADPVGKRRRIDLFSTTPSADCQPMDDMEHCMKQAVLKYKSELFGYTDPQGIPSLRRELQKHLGDHQVFARTDRICVTTGAQQAFSILTRMPFPGGKRTVVVEQPTYFGFLETAMLNGNEIVGIDRDERGIDLEALERIFRTGEVKFFYTIPRFLNPLGVSYDKEQQVRISRLAKRYGVYVVEDDYFADLAVSPKSDPLYSCEDPSHVIYIKSFSKIILPGLRICCTVLPAELVPSFAAYKQASDISSPILSQGALEIYLKCGMFKRHAARMREHYKDKMAYALQLCAERFDARVKWTSPSNGIFAALTLPAGCSASELVERLDRAGVKVMNVDKGLLPANRTDRRIRLCFMSEPKREIDRGLRIVEKELAKMMNEPWLVLASR